jgi:hypothetical protein
MSLKDILSPFTAWKHLVKDPVTIKDPFNREAAERYRGFHKNDIETCALVAEHVKIFVRMQPSTWYLLKVSKQKMVTVASAPW